MSDAPHYRPLPLAIKIALFLKAAALVGCGVVIYALYQETTHLRSDLANATSTITEKESALIVASSTIAELSSTLTSARESFARLEDAYSDELERNENFGNQIDDLSNTLNTLDKLAKLDEELLQKYSRVYFLNENYMPSKLKQIDNDVVLASQAPQYFHAEALPFLESLIKDAARDDIDLMVVSAYRTFDHQSALNEEYVQTYGEGANAFSASQGFSEHQLGTTVDFSTPELGGAIDPFGSTEAYQWMLKNAYKHGFVLSYPENNQYYVFEPWHWRFVGKDLARDLHRDDLHFYDLDQRELSEYLVSIFD